MDARAVKSRLGEAGRSFAVGAWLGWQIASNWTDPFLFAVYSVVKPVAGALYLLSGVVFPLDVLPAPLQALGKALPTTYWLEALRRALLGDGGSAALGDVPTGTLVLVLALSATVLALAAVLVFRLAEGIAHRRGLLDMQTTH